VADLLDDDGAPDPEKVKPALSELPGRKPQYAERIFGDVGQGGRPGPGRPGRGAVELHPGPDALGACNRTGRPMLVPVAQMSAADTIHA
jgi:hypothetical protein